MSEATLLVDKDDLAALAAAIFRAAGVAESDAAEWAEVLVWANLRGVDSHGVLRIPGYIDHIDNGNLHPRPDIRIEREAGALALLEADLAPGPVAMRRAMGEAIARARAHHVGMCVVRRCTHTAAVGFYARQAAAAGMAGMVMTASQPMMAYAGARVPGVSSNPLAIAVPGGAHPSLLIDVSTAEVAMGKIMSARDAGRPIPEGWALDAEGRPATDPNAVATLLPLGGAKGAGLSLLIECLTSLVAGFPLIAPVLGAGPAPRGRPINGLAVAIDIAAVADPEAFGREVDALAAAVTGLPKAEGVETIYAPGERGDAVLAERAARGIPLPRGTWTRLAKVAERFGVPMPRAR